MGFVFYLAVSIAVSSVFAFLCWKYLVRNRCYRFSDGKPLPGPKPIFLFGNALEVHKIGMYEAMHKWRLTYGDTYQFWMFHRPICFVQDLDIIKSISNSKDFASRIETYATTTRSENKGILFTNDLEHHKVHRSVVLKGLMKTSYLKGIAQTITETTAKQLQIWESTRNGQKAVDVSVPSSMSALTLDIIGKSAFSTEMNAIEGKSHAYQVFLRKVADLSYFFSSLPSVARFLLFSKWRDFINAREQLKPITHEMIQKRRKQEGIEFTDFLDMLITEVDPKTGQFFTEDVIHFDIADLLQAGHETTANTLGFSLYLLATNPEAQRRLQQEADQFPEHPSYEECARMEIAQAVVKETLRLYSIVPLLIRAVKAPTKISLKDGRSISLKNHDLVSFCMYALGRDERHYKDPERFDIDRWSHKEEEGGNSAWIPFGLGPSSCVGARMAMLEAKLILCKLSQKYDIRLHPEMGPLEIQVGVTLKPSNMRVLLYPRSNTTES